MTIVGSIVTFMLIVIIDEEYLEDLCKKGWQFANNNLLLNQAQRGSVWKAWIALKFGANVYAENKHKSTPSILAATNSNLRILNLLIKHGADPNLPDNLNQKVFIRVAGDGHLNIVNALIQKGINLNQQENIVGCTALMAAAASGRSEVVNLLLQKNAAPNQNNSVGLTALMLAVINVRNGCCDTINLLLKYRVNLYKKSDSGLNALDIAKKKDQDEVVNLLKKVYQAEASSSVKEAFSATTGLLGVDGENIPPLIAVFTY